MLAKLLLSRNLMARISIRYLLHLDSILNLYSIRIINLIFGMLEDRELSGLIGGIISNRLMVLFGLSILLINLDFKIPKLNCMLFLGRKNSWELLYLSFAINKIFLEV